MNVDDVSESESSDSEPEFPALSVESAGKKRSFTTNEKTAQQGGSAKRSRVSHLRSGIEDILATLNKDDTIEGGTSGEENPGPFQTPHCHRSKSAPGSSSRVFDKTPGKKGPGIKRKAVSHSATNSEEARRADTRTKSMDNTPNRFRSDTDLDCEGGDGNVSGAESNEHSPMPAVPQQLDVSAALKEITSLLNTVVKRIDCVENELSKRQSTSLSSSSAGERCKKSKVPLIVRVSYSIG